MALMPKLAWYCRFASWCWTLTWVALAIWFHFGILLAFLSAASMVAAFIFGVDDQYDTANLCHGGCPILLRSKGGTKDVSRVAGWRIPHPTLSQKKGKDGAPTFKFVQGEEAGPPLPG